jgi:hypothetical protein
MKAITLENYKGQDFNANILEVSNTKTGHGHWKVFFTIEFNGVKKDFSVLTTDSQFIDEMSELDSYSEIEERHIEKFYDQNLEERILEWIETQIED